MHAGWSRIRERHLVEYEGAGHMLMYERRAEISDLLDKLSARVPLAEAHGWRSTLTAPVRLESQARVPPRPLRQREAVGHDRCQVKARLAKSK